MGGVVPAGGHRPPMTNLFASYGLIHCAFLHDYRTGVEFGQLALNLSSPWTIESFGRGYYLCTGSFSCTGLSICERLYPCSKLPIPRGSRLAILLILAMPPTLAVCTLIFSVNHSRCLRGTRIRYRSVLQHTIIKVTNLNYHNIYHQIALTYRREWRHRGSSLVASTTKR